MINMPFTIDQIAQLNFARFPMILLLKWSYGHILEELRDSLLILVTHIISFFCKFKKYKIS